MQAGPLMLDLEGSRLLPHEAQWVQQPEVGGVILFARNIETADQVRALTAELKRLRPELLLAVDQEGGRVQRLREGFTPLPPMACLGELYQHHPLLALASAQWLGALMAAEVRQVGLDFSFAPVLDIAYGQSEVIGDRAFAADPEQVTALAGAFIDGMQSLGMAATGKHFPGHGYVAGDSHLELPVDPRSLADIERTCLQPFQALAPRLQGIMPAHVVYTQVDDQPAGFSRYWLDKLRHALGFTGTIFSDDLGMAGAAMAGDFTARADQALAAGCDMVLVCNDPAGAEQVLTHLRQQQDGQRTLSSLSALLGREEISAAQWLNSPKGAQAVQVAHAVMQQDINTLETLYGG